MLEQPGRNQANCLTGLYFFMATGKLTAKQQKFVDAYNGNATEAALAAGYSQKTAQAIGAENLRKPLIARAIRDRGEKEAAPLIASRQDRQRFWSDMMNNPKADPRNRLKASELLGKANADFTENINLRVSLEDKLRKCSDEELNDRLTALEEEARS